MPGLGSKNWLGDPTLAMVSVIVIHTWQWTPFAFMVLLASLGLAAGGHLRGRAARPRHGLAALPPHHPALAASRPSSWSIIMRTMVALTAFAAIFTVTAGGPGTATEILNLYAYRKSFTELSIGYGSALAVALLIVTILISAILFAMRRAK